MNEIPIKTTCMACGGDGMLSTGKTYFLGGREHPLLNRCTACEGKGTILSWVDVREFIQMLNAIAMERQAE